MAERNPNCTLAQNERNEIRCKNTCGRCGWNSKVAEARNQMIKENGLTKGPDGVRRLIIRKGVVTDGNT